MSAYEYLPPAFCHLRVAPADGRRVRLWLPVFLLWPLLLVLVVLGLIATIVVDAILLAAGRRYHHYTRLLIGGMRAINDTKGLSVHVRDDKTAVDLTVR